MQVIKKDHPHPCGEKRFMLYMVGMASGSPPPVWGKVRHMAAYKLRKRITPTRVGKSLCR